MPPAVSRPHSIRAAFLGLFVAALVLALGSSARAQTFPSLPFASPSPVSSGAAASAPVVLDGQTLFTVSVNPQARDQLPAAVRAGDIGDVLAQIIATQGSGKDAHTAYDPASLRVGIDRTGGQIVLTVVDAQHRDPLPIVTVTDVDAQAQQQPNTEALGAQWQEALQGALVHALVIRQPGAQQLHLTQAIVIGITLAALTVIGYGFVLVLGRRIDALTTDVEAHERELAAANAQPATPETAGAEAHHRHVTALSLLSIRPTRRLALLRSMRAILLWGLLLAWFGGGTWAAMQFPQTTPLGHTLLTNGFALALIWISAGLIDRTLAVAIERLPAIWDLRRYASADERTRQMLRVPTIVRAMNGFKTTILVFLALLATMTQLGIPVGSVVTIGGVAAIAVTLAAQNLIRDVVSGFLVLSEDQFVVGDFVTINGSSGMVERLTLRMVQIRDATGSLVTISHSSATSVVNHSRNWSRVDYAVSIDPAADVEGTIALIRSTIAELERDAEWKDAIVDPVEWIGVDGLSRDGIIIRARIKTAPLRQFALQRELNFRVSRAFAQAKIGYGAPVPATL
jgi:moderate conductance mechanosensitive channel